MPGSRSYEMRFSEQADEFLHAEGRDPAAVVHQALSLLRWLRLEWAAGSRTLIQRGMDVTEWSLDDVE